VAISSLEKTKNKHMTIIGAKTCIAQNMDNNRSWKLIDPRQWPYNGLTKHENEKWISKHIF
jgi:hypothetical protein